MTNQNDHSRFLVIGAGGFGRETMQLFRALSKTTEVRQKHPTAGFLDDSPTASVEQVANAQLFGSPENLRCGDGYVIAISSPTIKFTIHQRIRNLGAKPVLLVHPMSWIGEDVTFGAGTIVTAHCSITTNIRVGSHVHFNLGCTIGHDAVIEDYVTLSPGVHISGNVHIKTQAGLGTGAVVLPGITIGERAMVGAGAVVTSDVPDNTTVVGIPAKPMNR